MLYGVASLRTIRRRSLRFANEHAEIDAWLARVQGFAATDYALALEIARSQRLVKGYGDTHARGMRNYRKLVAVLPAIARTATPAARLHTLCEAALADEAGEKLDALLDALQKNDLASVRHAADTESRASDLLMASTTR